MTAIYTFIITIAPFVVASMIARLGFGLLTVLGANQLMTYLVDQIKVQLNGFSADLFQYAGLFGAFDFISIVLGAVTAKMALQTISRSLRIL